MFARRIRCARALRKRTEKRPMYAHYTEGLADEKLNHTFGKPHDVKYTHCNKSIGDSERARVQHRANALSYHAPGCHALSYQRLCRR